MRRFWNKQLKSMGMFRSRQYISESLALSSILTTINLLNSQSLKNLCHGYCTCSDSMQYNLTKAHAASLKD